MRERFIELGWFLGVNTIDQIINTAAKARLMSAGQLSCPIVFRGAGGAAFQLGAQHANSFDSFYAYTPGLIVVAPATPYDMKGLLKSSIRDDNPVVFFESELTYGKRGPVPEANTSYRSVKLTLSAKGVM